MSYAHGFTPEAMEELAYKHAYSSFGNLKTGQSSYDERSPLERAIHTLMHVEDPVSHALKELEKKSIEAQLDECFKPVWTEGAYPNVHAVKQCQNMVHDRVLGSYLEFRYNLTSHASSTMADCVKTKSSMDHVLSCMNDYDRQLKAMTDELRGFLKSNYSSYMVD